ncbi:hypothetical protein HDU76_006518 [Blyttiomyces sp. JEL0837]|nr:hypothetical protein HDU76_006518 [Blyttiomyces sp. JEL0837]
MSSPIDSGESILWGEQQRIKNRKESKKKMATEIDIDVQDHSQPPLVESPFLNSDIESFAIYCPPQGIGISSLLDNIDKWTAVDLLIIPFGNLQRNTVKDGIGGSGGAGVTELKGVKVDIAGLDVKGPAPAAVVMTRNLSVNSVFGAVKNVDLGDSKSEKDNTLNSLLASRCKYLIAMVDLDNLYDAFKRQRGTLTNFTNYVLNHIASGTINLACPINGFLFKASPKLLKKIESNELKIVKVIRALREKWNMSKTPPVVLLTDFGLAVWDSVKDWISGLVLHDMLMEPDGRLKIRFTTEQNHFEEKMNLVKGELSLRNDFCVLGIEAVKPGPIELSHQFKRHIVTWYENYGFKFWICHFRQFSEIADIRPFLHTELGSDMLEIATLPSIKKCRANAERCYIDLVDAGIKPNMDTDTWNQVFNELSRLPKKLIDQIRTQISKVSESDFALVMDERRPFPSPPRVSQLEGVLQFVTGQDKNKNVKGKIWSQATQTDLIENSATVTYVGHSYGQQRAHQVSKLILAVLLQLKEKKLLGHFKYNNDLDVNLTEKATTAGFANAISLFESIIENPTPATEWLLELMDLEDSEQFKRDLKNLVSSLKSDAVCVYLVKKAVFIPKETVDLPFKSIWSITYQEDSVVSIFVSDDHPCIEEVIIHAYMKHVNGWTTKRCVLLEGVISAQKCAEQDFLLPFPSRLCQEMDASCRSFCLDLIRNTEAEIRSINRSGCSDRERAYLVQFCNFVSQRAEYLLLERERFTDMMLQRVSEGYYPKNALESNLVKFMGLQTLSYDGLQQVQEIHEHLDNAITVFSDKLGHQQHLLAVCFLVFVINKACRRCAFLELEVAIQELSTTFLPDKDQVAVSLEMSTTQSNMQDIFNLSSLQLATAFHERVRLRMKEAEQQQEEQVLTEGEQFMAKNVDFSAAKYIGNAYIFVYPIGLDFILSNAIGSGIFFSSKMSEETLEAATMAFLVSFPFIGALMNSFGRTISFYFYHKSMTLMIMAVSHRLAAAFICLGFVSVLVSGIIYAYNESWVSMLFGFGYSFCFGLFMIMYTIMVTLSDSEVYWWQSAGTTSAIQALVLFLPAPLICSYVIQDWMNDSVIWALYTGALLLCALFMLYRYSKIADQYLRWPENVKITDLKEIEEWFAKIIPRPEETPSESQDEYQKRVRLWERSATELFSARMQIAIKSSSFVKIPIIKARVAQWKWEFPLMKWFLERSNLDPAIIKPFSPKWDNLAKQAVDELKKKYQTEKLNRGALLYALEAPAIVFGFLYFIIIFMDKWALLIASESLQNFLPNINEYNRGITFATIYLLATSGFLELSLHSCSAKMKTFKFRSLAEVDDPTKLVQEYQSFITSLYKKELLKMFFNASGILVVTSAVTIGLSWNESSMTTIEVFFIACFAFSGLLLGLFNKIFIQIEEWKLNVMLSVGMAISLGVSIALIHFLESSYWALSATVLACWSFGIACTTVRYYEHIKAPHYEISIAPNLRSSGQRFIGERSDWMSKTERDVYVSKLIAEKTKYQQIAPGKALGLSIQATLKTFSATINGLEADHPMQLAVKDMKTIIEKAENDFREAKIVVHQVPNALEAGGIPFSALAGTEGDCLRIFVTYQRASTEDQTTVVCEAIIHEVIERAGWSHSSACAGEIIMESKDHLTVQVPVRIQRQLDSAKKFDLKKLALSTEQNISRLAALGINIDQNWKAGEITHDDRVFLVKVSKVLEDLCENFNKGPSAIQEKVRKLMSEAPDSLSDTLKKTTLHSGTTINVSSAIYRNILLTLLATNVKELSLERLKIDPSFTRELDTIPKAVRPLFAAFHRLSRSIFNVINFWFIYENNPWIKQFLHRAYKGIVRVHYYTYKNNANRITRVDTSDGSNNRVSFVREVDLNINPEEGAVSTVLPPLEVLRYEGNRPATWTPKDSDKPISKGIFEAISNSSRSSHDDTYRISTEYYFNSQQSVSKAQIYRYQKSSDLFPHLRYVFDKEASRNWNPEQSSIKPIETHFFGEGGMVTSALLSRIYKITNEQIQIDVKYSYDHQGPGVGAKNATFSSKMPWSWEMVIEYAPYPQFDLPAQHATHHTIYTIDESKTSLASLEGIPVPTPDEVKDDHFNIMNMSSPRSIFDTNDFISQNLRRRKFRKCGIAWPFLRTQYIEYASDPYDTRKRRDMLWTSWRGGYIPGVIARNLDEEVLRVEPNLSLYWRYRNWGNTEKALEALKDKRQDLNNCLYVADRPASRTRLQIRYSDLSIFGIGGDSHNISSFDQGNSGDDDGQEILEVISLDSGTWPTGGGGVGSCRRDLIDSLTRVRWTAIAEISTAALEQRDYQIEKNINAIIYMPIFDTDFGNPYENIYRTRSYKDLRLRQMRTTDKIVTEKFVPLIKQLIEGCMEENLSSDRLTHYERIFVSLYEYLREHDWTTSWNHSVTQRVWIVTFLECASKLHRSKKIMNIETPTLSHISILFTLFSRLLLPLCLNIPYVPVVHVSHHGTQAIQGVIAKAVNGSRLIIWDHGMLWRERLFGLCKDGMSPFVKIGYSGLTRLCTRVAYNCADYVTPCTSVQNVMWGAWLSGGKYGDDKQSAELYKRCAPVLNGTNLEKFTLKRENAIATPTAVMLSHISPVKDILNAIKAAYYIVHEFKISNYQLHIYGSTRKDKAYVLACMSAISELDLKRNVFLKGIGNPSVVLHTGWIFVNSSITEGLPLALGEAGLCGLPVVCTDVGGSREVISDMKTGAIYGAVVPPSRPRQLAMAQLQVLAMTDGLDLLVNPRSKPSQVALANLAMQSDGAIEKRIMDPEVCQMRGKLGLMLRDRIQNVLSIARYWREHEQILWTGPLYDRLNKGKKVGGRKIRDDEF